MGGGAKNGSVIIDISDPDDDGRGDTMRGGGAHCSILSDQDEMILSPVLVVQ